MLTALEQGVKGEKWFRLNDKIFAERNLLAAFQQVAKKKGAAGVDHETVRGFERRLPDAILELTEALKNGRYTPQAIRRVHIPKPGTTETRPLGIPTVRDRVVQAAVVNVIEPIFERDFAEHSYGFRPGRGCKDALRRVDEQLRKGHVHVVDVDLKGYFDSIPHGRLMAEHGFEMVRYADDFVVLCQTAEDAVRALDLLKGWVSENGLTIHPTKTRIVDARTTPFDFLGYTFCGQEHWPRKKSIQKLRDTIRDKTPRTDGRSLQCVIVDVNRVLKGWFAYFKHSSHRRVYTSQDGWVRMRLRSILRRRTRRRGHGHGWDHIRWPNVFFAEHGLFSLVTAHVAAVQSSRR